uniref:ATP synthase complex subunit 8 n=1 Tax=Badis badis TaxID=248959 RepID=A0A679ELZ2_9TELE|nr:ATPase subunit 8 [Badis badis]
MPQLNTSPWFAILVFAWFIFLTIIPLTVMSHTFPNDPTNNSPEKPKAGPWNWPWY